jgi:hypothetical protein
VDKAALFLVVAAQSNSRVKAPRVVEEMQGVLGRLTMSDILMKLLSNVNF